MLLLLSPLIIISILVAAFDTNSAGLFFQERIGKNSILFSLVKLQTIHPQTKNISSVGKLLRKYKIDELPQLLNIVQGTMSFVGPRPDIAGYADILEGDDRIVLSLRPGITGLASLKYRNEEVLLQQQTNPTFFNDEVIWPDKVRINSWYAKNRTLWMDFVIISYTVMPFTFDVDDYIEEHSTST